MIIYQNKQDKGDDNKIIPKQIDFAAETLEWEIEWQK